MRYVHEFLEYAALRTPSKTAVVAGDARATYAEIETHSNRLAHGLIAAGVAPGDRVVVCLENSVETVVAIFGILKAGAAFAVINPGVKADKLAHILLDAGAAALITAADVSHRRLVNALPPGVVPRLIWIEGLPDSAPPAGTCCLSWGELLSAGSDRAPETTIDEGGLGTLIYTSGTTGQPKGVMAAHRDMVFAATAIAASLENTADDVIFSALPLAFTYGLYQLLTAVRVGATLVLEKNFAFPARALEIMARERATGFPGVPTMYALLLGITDLARYDLGSVRYLTNAAARLPVQHIQQLRQAFPRASIYSMYGQTECKRTSVLPPGELDRRPDSVGLPLPGSRVSIVDEAGRPVPPGAVGELVVHGPHLMRGYWGMPDETARALRTDPLDGEPSLYSGDLFRMDEEGYLYFVSRKDDIIKSRGEKVSPTEVENVLYALAGVDDVAVVGVPDPLLGEAVKAVIVRAEGSSLSERDVHAFCAQHLEDFMRPKFIEFARELPRSANGKLIRRSLRECVA